MDCVDAPSRLGAVQIWLRDGINVPIKTSRLVCIVFCLLGWSVATRSVAAQSVSAEPAASQSADQANTHLSDSPHHRKIVLPEQVEAPITLPAHLPDYAINLDLDTSCRKLSVTQRVTWTNTSSRAEEMIVFHVFPKHRPNKKMLDTYERTLESFRLNPRFALDYEGNRFQLKRALVNDQQVSVRFPSEPDTHMEVLPNQPVAPGQSVVITLEYDMTIPPVMGRFGQYGGITSLANWYPMLAYHDDAGWNAPPYIAWHQPFLMEAAHYHVTLTVDKGEEIACTGHIASSENLGNGKKRVQIEGVGLRDFSLVASKRFERHTTEIDGVKINVLALPEHRYYAGEITKIICECFPLYREWFGRYPHKEFTIAESYFGWNGNETSSMVLIDQRVFDSPHLAVRYIDNLLSHEICHQWWYSTVGTDGYRESWMDEGFASYFTLLRLSQKYGSKPELFDWCTCTKFLPNVSYHALQFSGYQYYRARGGKGTVLQSLQDIEHVHNLFFLVYGRGNRVVSMLHQRLGDEQFFGFMRHLYRKYAFKVLFVADFERELCEYTCTDYKPFLDDWLRTTKITDWRVESGSTSRDRLGFYTTKVRIAQKAEINEPVEIEFRRCKFEPARSQTILFQPDQPETWEKSGATIKQVGDKCWEIAIECDQPLNQVEIDPSLKVLDAFPFDNRLYAEPVVRLTPLYTPIDEAMMVHPFDRVSIVAGPNVDIDGRFGLRASIIQQYRYRFSPFLAYDMNDAQWTAGIDAEWLNALAPNVSLGARFDQTIQSALYDDPRQQGKLFARWTQFYTTSLIYPNNAFAEVYYRFGDNFYPDEDFRRPTDPRVEDYREVQAVGVSYHADSMLPYWDPERGIKLDVNYEYGFRMFGEGENYHRLTGQISKVQRMPAGLGWFSETSLVGRVGGGIGGPDNGEHFRFGGPMRFRALRSEDAEGNAFWVGSLDWRYPIIRDLDVRIVDNLLNLKHIHGALLYDVGEVYQFGQGKGVDHAIGTGLYFQFAALSFLDVVTFRVEYAYSLRKDTSVAWFGIYYAF